MADLQTADLLVELGCEELPPKALAGLAEAFYEGVRKGLEDAGLGMSLAESRYYFTPRRMTVHFVGVEGRQPDRKLEKRGPAVKAAFDEDGQPTQAALGFARSVGRDVGDLDRLVTDKGEWLACSIDQPGQALSALVFPILQSALDGLPVPKPMRWSDHEFSFVRPVHWLMVLHGERVLDGELYGCRSGRLTRGHRIHAPGPHEVSVPSDYVSTLERAFVMADHEARVSRIRETAEVAGTEAGGVTRITDELLAEVCNLVEWPVAVLCSFEEEFLQVPQEALIASMEAHQKFFPVLEPESGRLTQHFVVMANLESKDIEQVRAGFERVVRPRLADARFFWDQDLKSSLESSLDLLDNVVFQKQLGSVGDKSRRIASLSKKIADISGASPDFSERAALLCKCDLVSQMVGEFPELQGTMGAYYASHSGEPEDVARAIGSHYRPRFAGDDIPDDPCGQVVAMADRLDTLVGIFAAGLKPTGNKDPYALRRAALGLIRILLEGGYTLEFNELLQQSVEALNGTIDVSDETLADLKSFLRERLRHYLIEQGFSANQVRSVLAAPLHSMPDLWSRVAAVASFMLEPAADSLVAANKRIGNILKKQERAVSDMIDTDRFQLEQEGRLFEAIQKAKAAIRPHFDSGAYEAVLAELAQLKAPVDEYFDEVMVMDEDPDVRANRLAQLADLKSLFDRVADFSRAD